MKATDLGRHIAKTYATLRLALVVIGFSLPLILWVGGLLSDEPLAGSMSAYYHSPTGRLRDCFVGGLFGVGAILVAYHGYTKFEDRALDLAGIFIVLVALVPMAKPVAPGGPAAGDGPFSWHGAFAVCFFVCIAYVCIFQASATLSLIDDERRRDRYVAVYKWLGRLMILSPAAAFAVTLLPTFQRSLVFFVEMFGVYVFATYWLVKGAEIRRTQADRRAARGRLWTRRPDATAQAIRGTGVAVVEKADANPPPPPPADPVA